MEIRLPTLAELEQWWIAHPKRNAVQEDSESCLIGVPLREQHPEYVVNVSPSRVDYRTGELRAGVVTVSKYVGDAFEEVVMPLPEELNALAKEFDLLDSDEHDEDLDDDDEAWKIRHASECVELIHDLRERLGQ